MSRRPTLTEQARRRGAALDRRLIKLAVGAPMRTAAIAWWDQQLLDHYQDMLLRRVEGLAPERAAELRSLLEAADTGIRDERYGWITGEKAIIALTEK